MAGSASNMPLQPDDRVAFQAALSSGDIVWLKQACLKRLRRESTDRLANCYLGLAIEAEGDRLSAARQLEVACGTEGDAEAPAQLARLLVVMRRDDAASYWVDRAIAANPKRALDADTIGCVLSRLGRHAEAVTQFRDAVNGEPHNVQFRYNLAVALGFVGDPQSAQEHEEVLALDPDFARSHLAIATQVLTASPARIERLRHAIGRAADPTSKLLLRVAVSKELERAGDDQTAFGELKRGKDDHRGRISYDSVRDAEIVEGLQRAFADPSFFQGEGFAGVAPIFVVGMPRSGTTLVERVLTAHPMLSAAGELPSMPLAVKSISGVGGRSILDPSIIEGLSSAAPIALAEEYLRRSQSHVDVETHFVDKLPMNFLYAGFIARAFPRAKIICLRRNPMDVLWSNYKHLFAQGVSTFDYSYDVEDTARYVAGFENLVLSWRKFMPGRIFEIRYEDLVADFGATARALVAHADLPWDDSCASYFMNNSPVATPSGTQVRQPIYKTSINRWQRFAKELEPGRRILQAAGLA